MCFLSFLKYVLANYDLKQQHIKFAISFALIEQILEISTISSISIKVTEYKNCKIPDKVQRVKQQIIKTFEACFLSGGNIKHYLLYIVL